MAMKKHRIYYANRELLYFENHYLTTDFNKKNEFHKHHSFEISLVKKGSGNYSIDNKTYDVKSGDVFIFNNIEYHKLYVESDKLINMVLHIDPRFIWAPENDYFDNRFIDIFLNRSKNFENRLDRDNPVTKEIAALLLDIDREFEEGNPEYELMVKVRILNILVLILRHFDYVSRETSAVSSSKREREILNTALSYIDNNLFGEISLEKLSKTVHMSMPYFSVFFKRHIGLPPIRYINIKKIREALKLLRATDKTILEIATLCGFNSTASFNKQFRKIMNNTPRNFRKQKDEISL